ncbi:MAG: GAF domain-containing protein [Candidatus Magnetominusculus sp. LBB02]|nr:GAF domain-containing protein [Candidatus Magnetominusculus sp. LBB02]
MDSEKAAEFGDFSYILNGIIKYFKERCSCGSTLDADQQAIIADMMGYVDMQAKLKRKLLQIGVALSAERNINALLDMIVSEAMTFTNADGGTLYIMSPDERSLIFKIIRNNSLTVNMGGRNTTNIPFPPVPLYRTDGTRNTRNVSTYVALTGETINFPDVYEVEGFDFQGTKIYDKNNGYRSRSMMVTPLKNHENEIIGVLQLINAGDGRGNVVPFSPDYQYLIESLASQAAVAITNTTLIKDLGELLDSFIKVIASAIDEKSPYTGGHIRRVAELTLDIAMEIYKSDNDRWKDFTLTSDEQEELRIAAWMHDIGKITTPEHVVDKSAKLETIYDRINTVTLRLEVLKRDIEIKYLTKKAELEAEHGGNGRAAIEKLDEDFTARVREIDDDIEFLKQTNVGGEFTSDEKIERIHKIASYKIAIGGNTQPLLNEEEVLNLSIQRGTLTVEERKKIENHAAMTYKMLSQLPWPKKMKNVPTYAAQHHEKLDGTGYPKGVPADQLSTKSRIMAIADIFEALTAADRPYRPGKKLSECVKILGFMAKDKHVDPELVDFFVTSGLLVSYAKKEMKQYQLDNFVYNGKEYAIL